MIMKNDIAKKKYEKPFMQVVMLQHQTQLLQQSLPADPDSPWPGGQPW